MTPLDYYREQCAHHLIFEDQEQLIALRQLQRVFNDILNEYQQRNRLFAFLRKPQLVQGLYLWGGVGIGKTFLMDCFYHCLPFAEKKRMHFHAFMQWVHQALKIHQGKKEPLQIIAKEFAKRTMIICFDEFFVSDIADAMILARLFKALFAQGVCLVATSNTMPDDLYKHGLQRRSFLPAIEMLKQFTIVMHIPSTMDYRLRHLKQTGVFYTPHNDHAVEHMEKTFHVLSNGEEIEHAPIEICGRMIPIKKQAGNIIWFDFDVICNIPRSQHDYLAIASKYKTVFISNIPIIPPNAKNIISLFIRLIDVFYDNHIRLIFSAADRVENIYNHGYMMADYARTRSRLIEMQSERYFSE